MAKKESVTYEEIVRAIRAGQYSPVYYLMGEESYYIDKISDYIVDTALTEQERDFNLTVLYGPDTNVSEIITAARQYPMGAARQVVVVREAQRLDFNEESQGRLILYLERPQPTTVLVFCHKHGALDKRLLQRSSEPECCSNPKNCMKTSFRLLWYHIFAGRG